MSSSKRYENDTNNIFDLEGCEEFLKTNINPITKRQITDKKRIEYIRIKCEELKKTNLSPGAAKKKTSSPGALKKTTSPKKQIYIDDILPIIGKYAIEPKYNGSNFLKFILPHLNALKWSEINQNPNAVNYLGVHKKKIDWVWLSSNPNAIHLLEKNQSKINWENLSRNPNAIDLLEKNPNKIVWSSLSMNPNAIPLLEKNIKEIDWDVLISKNPNIFTYDHKKLYSQFEKLTLLNKII